ncbi:MAG: hypothetical protein COV35_01500 [Alphaproteobacteria bacterium CG11_big_fil_rev_8_21_14_0_20_39_49]|nr:MAG: hypothetical protein COV35_01500 [Alphaproteobacteria bacterium CG11_big_fil_rev_8_21_14_0_20_39_49]
MNSKKKNNGFTLIELSIVIVIIGLIVAGVVGGQALVKQAKLRSVVSEHNQVKLAMNAFKLEYDALPGDFNNAFAYWPAAAQGCNAAGTGAGVQAECNGDGDKQIELASIGGAIESYMAWKHLQLADLTPGSFFPSDATAVATSDLNIKIPASKYTGAGITIVYDDLNSDATAGDGLTSGGRVLNRNVALFGGIQTDGTDMANGLIFDAKDVQGIDEKIDDGDPVTGAVVGVGVAGTAATDCIDTAPDPDTYNLDGTNTATAGSGCAVAFEL